MFKFLFGVCCGVGLHYAMTHPERHGGDAAFVSVIIFVSALAAFFDRKPRPSIFPDL